MYNDPYEEYYKQAEPNNLSRYYAWNTAIGLQAVDRLIPSKMLVDYAQSNIDGDISIGEVQNLIDRYYKETPKHKIDARVEEADKVSVQIAMILGENAFSFTPNEYISIHKKLFKGIYKFNGKIRDYNITKREWVLDGDTVTYGSASELKATLEYDIKKEKSFSYKGLSTSETISHLARFISDLWQIHIFGEGNTRTTAVFLIKYLRMLGYNVGNDAFADNSWYFRNSLVRANYRNIQLGIYETTSYLELFFRNLLLGETHELKNRYLHIGGMFMPSEVRESTTPRITTHIRNRKVHPSHPKVNIEPQKVNIQEKKVNIDTAKVNIDIVKSINSKADKLSNKTRSHAIKMYEEFGNDTVFGNSLVVELLNLEKSSVSKLLAKLSLADIITEVSGQGKAKYKFREFE